MTTDNKFSLSPEQTQQIESVYPKLHSIINRLEPVVAKKIMKDLHEISDIFKNVFLEHWEKEEDNEERIYELFEQLGDEHNFQSVWSMYEVNPETIKTQLFSDKPVKSITYESWGATQKIQFENKGKKLTWFDMWQEAEKLIAQSGDTHHIFIEDFLEDKKGHYSLITGS